MKKILICFILVFLNLPTIFTINCFSKTISPGEFKLIVKSAYQNNQETIIIKYSNFKPRYQLDVILKSPHEILNKEFQGITNGEISIDKNDGLRELTKYNVTIKIIDLKNNKILHISEPFPLITGRTNKLYQTRVNPDQELEKLNREFLSGNSSVSIKNLFLDYLCSIIEYRPENDTVYAISLFSKINSFISINLHTKKRKILNQFPEITGIPRQASAIDNVNGRFFFIGKAEKDYLLYVLDIFTGKILKTHHLEDTVNLLQYNKITDKLIGIQRPGGSGCSSKWIELNTLSGETSVIKEITHLSRILSLSSKIDYTKSNFLFLGKMKDNPKILNINILSGELSTIDTYQVDLENYRIHSFDRNQSIGMICTSGVQLCTGIAGYSKEHKIGFITHISRRFKRIPLILQEIDDGLKELTGSGLRHMNIIVVGGLKSYNDSFNNVITAYRELLQKYHVKYGGNKLYHLGKSYSIVLSAEGINIF